MHKSRLIVALALMQFTSASYAQVGNHTNVLNPNIAETDELNKLPGSNDQLAAKIVAARPFESNEDLDALLGSWFTDEQKAALRVKLFLPVNLNTASENELKLVPGINQRMVREFQEYRPYKSLEQFRREIGKYVSDDEVTRYEQYVFVPLALNSASSEALATIPGMSPRMVHEFQEYRPYTSIEQFRREIGKYVDEDEVARLERYVFID